ncbi:hypothetical protein [Lacimicrobium alkaliphilum]|uniref:Major facilitator superfamily (MFS) profile domain-containing protein n=1 Tax=Lacimicrobium alkaliphilum TaxID=1526571 RepID=A0ABQ1RSZ8_9ALTE|nr:hypothetical protein [Lacimicrobium alkaliphilum]GGD79487.1 hypothetical protein GCM10011357_38070 [Lacimicrobium alkaliphilum]
MKAVTTKLLAIVVFLTVLAGAIGSTIHEGWLTTWFLLFIFVGLPVLILAWIDLGSALRSLDNPTPLQRMLGVLFGVPQAVLGITSVFIGLSIVGWVLYNSLVEMQPQYSGSFLTLGVGPALVIFGLYWARAAFKREGKSEND